MEDGDGEAAEAAANGTAGPIGDSVMAEEEEEDISAASAAAAEGLAAAAERRGGGEARTALIPT